MRSNDLFLGLPHNIVQFTSLQEIVAGWLDVDLGAYNHVSDSLHYYLKQGSIKDRVKPVKVPCNNDSLMLPKSEFERVLGRLLSFGELLIGDNRPEQIVGDLEDLSVPPAYFNLAAILAAEALRRRNERKLSRKMSMRCSNDCLKFLFDRWLARTEGT